jgi:FKBP-type peptidyl-prolyl cis-trans isomerase 2
MFFPCSKCCNIFCDSHYRGFLDDGTCFDDSFKRGLPVYFVIGAGQVLHGWEMVLPILSRGETARIVLPPEVKMFIFCLQLKILFRILA